MRPALEAAVEVARLASSAQPPLPPPRALRPLVRLHHLPDRALPQVRAVLDGDDGFRTLVAASTTEELVGRPSWLFLQRPDGWEEAVEEEAAARRSADAAAGEARSAAAAERRLAAVEESRRAADTRAAALAAEVAKLKDRLAEERRARKAAATEAGRLRRRVADLEAEAAGAAADLEQARAYRESLLADVAGADPPLVPAPAAPPAPDPKPVRRALEAIERARADLGGWLDAVADPPPSGPPQRAAGGAGARRRPAPLPPAVFADTVEAADHLVRLDGVVVLVDGYNVTLLAHPELDLPEQRRWLADSLVGLVARCGAEVVVVFDGDGDVVTAPPHGPRRTGVNVRYTVAGVEADDHVLALAADVPQPRPVVVVSDDRRVRDGAMALGANVVGSGVLVELLRR